MDRRCWAHQAFAASAVVGVRRGILGESWPSVAFVHSTDVGRSNGVVRQKLRRRLLEGTAHFVGPLVY